MMTELLVLSTVCGGVAVFLAVWAVGDWLTSWQRVWLPGPNGGDVPTIMVPPHIAPYLTGDVPFTRVEEPWGTVLRYSEESSP